MDEELEAIRGPYLARLRSLKPRLLAWWERRLDADGEEQVELRWPTGLAGHPLVIAAFREAFLAVEALNSRRADAWTPNRLRPEDDASWGLDPLEPGRPAIRPYTVLVDELSFLARDVVDLVEGMVFVPIGLDGDEDFV